MIIMADKQKMAAPSSASGKTVPKDAEVMVAILKDMGITDYEPRLINQMLEFTYRYVTDVLDDAQAYGNHAGRTEIDAEDIKLAIQNRLDHSFTTPPPREFLMEIARQKNNNPLPPIKPHNGHRLPPDRYCLSASNYRLRPLHKRATLTVPSRLGTGLGVGSKLPANITLSTKQPHSMGVRMPSTSIVLSKSGGTPVSIIKTVSRSSSTPSINMQPASVSSRSNSATSASTSQTIIKTQVGIPQVNLKRKREEDDR